MTYDAIIIGGGLGGLQCGYILAKHGLRVCVLEKNARAGGCLQTFRRGGHTFDTGFHYVGGLDEGQPLHRLFAYFGLLDLPWRRMDGDGFDQIVINNRSYLFANGYERFVESLSAHFPRERQNLKRYTAFLQSVSEHIFDAFARPADDDIYGSSLFARSAYDYLTETIGDPLLRSVLSGASLKMELNPRTLPLYIFAQINASFIQSAWRLKGGGSQIADSLVGSIERLGGVVRTNACVTRLVETDGRIAAAEVNNCPDDRLEARYFVADIHPSLVVPMIGESRLIRNIYRRRIGELDNTFGMFTANVALKSAAVPYQNRNTYIYETDDVWQYAERCPGQPPCALVSFTPPDDDSTFAQNIDILTPMYWPEVAAWEGTSVGRRGADYLSFKERKAEECIRLAARHIDGLDGAVDKIYTCTPLSYRDYIGAPHGSAYGIRKDYSRLMTTLLSPRTPEPNLFLTGQNLNLHGALGVSMTAFLTAAEILPEQQFYLDL